jgi:hypothetical protein
MTYSSIQLGKRGPRSVGYNSHPWIPAKLDLAGNTARMNPKKLLMSLTVLLNDSWLNVLMDLHEKTQPNKKSNVTLVLDNLGP